MQGNLIEKLKEANPEDFLDAIIGFLEKARVGSEFYRAAELFLGYILAEYNKKYEKSMQTIKR